MKKFFKHALIFSIVLLLIFVFSPNFNGIIKALDMEKTFGDNPQYYNNASVGIIKRNNFAGILSSFLLIVLFLIYPLIVLIHKIKKINPNIKKIITLITFIIFIIIEIPLIVQACITEAIYFSDTPDNITYFIAEGIFCTVLFSLLVWMIYSKKLSDKVKKIVYIIILLPFMYLLLIIFINLFFMILDLF